MLGNFSMGEIMSTEAVKPLKRLSALDRVFESTGTVIVRCGLRELELPIQAVDMESVEGIIKQYRPRPPVREELRQGRKHVIVNEADPEYQERLTEYNRINTYAYVCFALALDIEDKVGKVVWSADNTTHDLEAARAALKDMGIVDGQLLTITQAALDLTRVTEEVQVSD